jgi:hypothetical protein
VEHLILGHSSLVERIIHGRSSLVERLHHVHHLFEHLEVTKTSSSSSVSYDSGCFMGSMVSGIQNAIANG